MSFTRIERSQVGTAEVQMDCYSGADCEGHTPHWLVYADGDKDSDAGDWDLRLSAKSFPPGTQMLIMEPLCPRCARLRDRDTSGGWMPKCECGFDWHTWEEETYG